MEDFKRRVIMRIRESQIRKECDELADFLIDKNRAYGDSALNPIRVFSQAGATEQLLVRIDDKLSRISQGNADNEDAILDLLGYLILLRIAQRRKNVSVEKRENRGSRL